ncbi:MAG TPA: PqqD family peptide modification chaperone [Gemmatimonadaceae bacterium]
MSITSGLTVADAVVASRDQVSADVAGEAVILGMRDGVYYGVDRVAARIWTLVQRPVVIHEVVQAICDEYDVEPAECAADVLAFVELLLAKGLVVRAPAAPAS